MKTIKKFAVMAIVASAALTSCKENAKEVDPFATLDFTVSPEFAGIQQEVKFEANDATLGKKYQYQIKELNDTLIEAVSGKASFKFKDAGEFNVSLLVDSKSYKKHSVNVSASNYKSGKKLFISQKENGAIYSYDIDGAELLDTEVKAGKNAMTLKWANDKLYIFDAGTQLNYIESKDAIEGEAGSIKTYSPSAVSTSTVINFTDQAYDDAYFGFVDGENIYWADRNNDVTSVAVGTENKEFTFVENTRGNGNSDEYPVTYKTSGIGMGWGAYNGAIQKMENEDWYESSPHKGGIYKFTVADQEVVKSTDGPEADGVIVPKSYLVGDFYVGSSKIYFNVVSEQGDVAEGVYFCDLDGNNIKLIDGTIRTALGGAGVFAHSSIAVDEKGGKIYWTYLAKALTEEEIAEGKEQPMSGVKSANLDGTDVELVVEVENAIGLTLAPVYE